VRRRRRAGLLGYLTILPASLYVLGLVGVPLALAIWYSLSNVTVNQLSGSFVGLANYIALIQDPTFLTALINSLIYGVSSTVITAIVGTLMAFVLVESFPGKPVLRFLMLLPWTIPIALTVLGWQWMFDSQYSIINWIGVQLHLESSPGLQWLGEPNLAMVSVITVNVWHNMPFGAIILIAGLTSIPPDIIDAAKIDGATFMRRFVHVMLPMMAPIISIGLIFNLIFNFTDLTVVYLLTQGGPANATTILPFYAFQVGITSGNLSEGAAVTLFLLPVLLLVSIIFLRQLGRAEV
jgi:multiple sugar transport system permease protein